MKKYNISLAIIVLVLASLACQTIMGGGNATNVPDVNGGGNDATATTSPDTTGGDNTTVGGDSEFPVTSDAFNVAGTAETVSFQTKLSVADVLKFYRDDFGKKGYKEDTSMSLTFGKTFTMVFTGHASGKSIYVVGADAGDGSLYVTITLQ